MMAERREHMKGNVERARRQRQRSLAIALALAAFIAVIYAVTIVKLHGG